MASGKGSRIGSRRSSGGLLPRAGSAFFWFVAGVGLVERGELREMLEWSRTAGGGVVLLPPYHESDLPVGSVVDLPPDAEEAALACLVEGLFKHLKANGKFRKVEQALPEIEKIMASARAVMTETSKSE